MDIVQLPAELQEAILFNLDGVSLARAQCVCKLWKNCVENLSKVKTIWFDKCVQEIPTGTLLILAGTTPCRTAGTWAQWRKLYQRWYCSRFVKSWNVENVWQQRHFTQRTVSDRNVAKQTSLLQFCGMFRCIVITEWYSK